MGGVAIADPGSPGVLHSGHSDTMNGTLTAKNFKYKSPRTSKLNVSGGAFIPENDTSTFDHNNYSGGAQPNGGSRMVAPIDLPNGARVTKVSWYHLTGAAAAGSLHLESSNRTGGHTDMASISSTACAATPCAPSVDTTIGANTIDNAARHYGLWLADDSGVEDLSTLKVIITYKVGAPGPASSRPLPGATFTGRVRAHN